MSHESGEPAMGRPLDGLRVLDFTHAAAGPFTTMFLADMGADVIKIEKPGRGDGARYMGSPMLGPLESDYYVALNRSKRSLLVDLGVPDGQSLIRDVAKSCDVVVQNFRPSVMDRLGVGFGDLAAVRQGLVYCSISAFGSTGPMAKLPANDIIMQSVSGLMGITGEVGGGPVRIGAPVSDYATGLFALSGILSSLLIRDQCPEGQHVEVSMLDASMALMANYLPSVVTLGARIERLGRGHAQIVPYQAFRCSDADYIMVGAFTQGFWRGLCEAVGRPEWKDDPRYLTNADRLAHRDVLLPDLERIFLTRSRNDWAQSLESHDVPSSPVLELHDAVMSAQVEHNETIVRIFEDDKVIDTVNFPVKSSAWTRRPAVMPPSMGRDTESVLRDTLGLEGSQIADLIARGVIATGDDAHDD